ncbi:hypothetical protein AVEN_144441-1 [Araneus ventricosus]|uniref:Uncharacterized protein n=1 Tax=Araneus ventricosus TaxID=182803 RepID=A0A4Y2E2V8_ARAVE|nr:hypothetical protein AVEN_144441-1 [Araneus ventricosus]
MHTRLGFPKRPKMVNRSELEEVVSYWSLEIEVKHHINRYVSDTPHLDMFGKTVTREYRHPRTVDELKKKINKRSRAHLLQEKISTVNSHVNL